MRADKQKALGEEAQWNGSGPVVPTRLNARHDPMGKGDKNPV